MMKRTYIQPTMCATEAEHELPLAASGVVGSNGIGYGGVDSEGMMDPDAKEDYFGETLFDE